VSGPGGRQLLGRRETRDLIDRMSPRARPRFLTATAALQAACVALGMVSSSPSCAESLKAQYSLSLLGLSFGTAYASGEFEPEKYHIDISMKTSGLANLINNTRGAATASGRLAASGPEPASFAHTLANDYETRSIRMTLAGNAVRALKVEPPPWDASQRIPVTDEQKQHVVDPVSALIMSVPAGAPLVGPSACNRTIPVFDGVTRFDVRLSYVETRAAQTKGYEGPVSVCTARYQPISGHRPDSSATRFMAENREMSVWLAPLQKAHAVAPLRINIKTSAGTMSIDAVEFEVGGAQSADGSRR